MRLLDPYNSGTFSFFGRIHCYSVYILILQMLYRPPAQVPSFRTVTVSAKKEKPLSELGTEDYTDNLADGQVLGPVFI